MSRNISLFEKIIIIILVLGAILGGVGYLLVRPAYNSIELVDTQIAQKKTEIAEATRLIQRAREVELIYDEERERATTVYIGFYEEMTTTEAITMVQEFLNGANGGRGHTAVEGIAVTDIEGRELYVLPMLPPRDISYALREFALRFARPPEIDPDEEIWDPYRVLLHYTMGPAPADSDTSEAANKARAEREAAIAHYFEEGNNVFFFRDVTAALRENVIPPNSDDRTKMLEHMRLQLAPERVEIGVINVVFNLELTTEEYANFLEYISNFELLTYTPKALLKQTPVREVGELNLYEFVLDFYVMMPIDPPPPPSNPFSAEDLQELEAYGEGLGISVDDLPAPSEDEEE
ncbi:MAG: hypothetical protein FWH20_06350 [Oscillospiraceae bacterium]|nr:hypothetical protein [Oscillospiraceae bacterium]